MTTAKRNGLELVRRGFRSAFENAKQHFGREQLFWSKVSIGEPEVVVYTQRCDTACKSFLRYFTGEASRGYNEPMQDSPLRALLLCRADVRLICDVHELTRFVCLCQKSNFVGVPFVLLHYVLQYMFM